MVRRFSFMACHSGEGVRQRIRLADIVRVAVDISGNSKSVSEVFQNREIISYICG